LRQYLQSNPVDLLFIQEHKLRGKGVEEMERQVWKRATTLFTYAELGYNAANSCSGKGEVATFIAPKCATHLLQFGTVLGGRVLWFILSHMLGGDIGFINIYPPVAYQARKGLLLDSPWRL